MAASVRAIGLGVPVVPLLLMIVVTGSPAPGDACPAPEESFFLLPSSAHAKRISNYPMRLFSVYSIDSGKCKSVFRNGGSHSLQKISDDGAAGKTATMWVKQILSMILWRRAETK